MRIDGAKSQTHGEFVLKEDHIYNHGRPFSMNIDPSGKGEFREYMSQSVKLNSGQTNKLVGRQLNFKFTHDGDRVSTFASTCEWKFFKVL